MEEEEATGAAADSPGASDGATLAAAAARRLERVSLIYAEAGWAAERMGGVRRRLQRRGQRRRTVAGRVSESAVRGCFLF